MKALTVQIPDTLDEREAKTLFAAKLYEKGSLSLGQAADLAGYSKRTFMGLLGTYDVSVFDSQRLKLLHLIDETYDVSVFDYSEAELEKDILNAQNYHL